MDFTSHNFPYYRALTVGVDDEYGPKERVTFGSYVPAYSTVAEYFGPAPVIVRYDHFYSHVDSVQPDTVEQFTGLHDSTKFEDTPKVYQDLWRSYGLKKKDWKGYAVFVGDKARISRQVDGKTVISEYRIVHNGHFFYALPDGANPAQEGLRLSDGNPLFLRQETFHPDHRAGIDHERELHIAYGHATVAAKKNLKA